MPVSTATPWPCPYCGAAADEPCKTSTGKLATEQHAARATRPPTTFADAVAAGRRITLLPGRTFEVAVRMSSGAGHAETETDRGLLADPGPLGALLDSMLRLLAGQPLVSPGDVYDAATYAP